MPVKPVRPRERPVAVQRLQRRGRHPLAQARTLAVGQARPGDPVGEGQAATGDEHAAALAQDGGLVLDVQQRLLAHARVEVAAREGQGDGVAPHDPDQPAQAHAGSEPGRAGGPEAVQLEGHHPAALAQGENARRTAQPGAHIQHATAGGEGGPTGQGLHRGQAAVVILIEVEQIFGAQARERAPPERHTGQDVVLVDGVVIVEVDDAHGGVP